MDSPRAALFIAHPAPSPRAQTMRRSTIRRSRHEEPRALLARVLALCAACVVAALAPRSLVATASPQSVGRAAHVAAKDEARASSLIEEGARSLANGDAAAARNAFTKALEANPQSVEAHTYLGVLADGAGSLEEAERHFAAAAALAPFSASAHNNLGAVLVRMGRTQAAAAQFEVSLKIAPMQPSALVNLAQLRSSSGKPEDLRAARDLFGRAMTVAPDAEIARSLVVIALRLGERERAAAAYRNYAARLADSSSKATTSSTPAEPSSPVVSPSTVAASAASRSELGRALLEGDLVDEALSEIPSAGRALESAVARGLDAAPVYAELADVYEAAGHAENAIPAMRLALARDPKNESYHFRYGLLLIDTGAPAAAVIRLNESLKLFPSSSRLWLALGVAQLTDGKNAEAEESFRRSLELDPKSLPALGYLGTTHVERGDYAQALRYYERAIAADNTRGVLYYLAADTMLKMSDADDAKAERYLARAVELDPSLASAHLALAKIYEREERWADAAAHLERAEQLAPDLNETHYHLGRVYQRLRRPEDARRELALFKEQSETEKQRRETERRDLVRRLADVRF
jgi:protein O-GlcNAc transferase